MWKNIIKHKLLFFERKRSYSVAALFLLHSGMMISAVAALILFGADYSDYLLRGDGYFKLAGEFAVGNFFASRSVSPLYPLLLSPIHFLPEVLHPFARLALTQAFVLGILFILSEITKNRLRNVQYLVGGILIIFNPVFLQWTLRMSPDLLLTFLLGAFIYYLIKYYQDSLLKHAVLVLIFFNLSLFVRPSFVLIPGFLVLISFFNLKDKRMVLLIIILFITTVGSYVVNSVYVNYSRSETAEFSPDANRSRLFIHNLILNEVMLETMQFHKGTIDHYNINYDRDIFTNGASYFENREFAYVRNYNRENPDGSTAHMLLLYAKENPNVVMAKYLFGPVHFFNLSSREWMSYLLLFYHSICFMLLFFSMKHLLNSAAAKNYFLFIFTILFGYFFLHWLTHSYSRYAVVIIPYLFIWVGILFHSEKTGQNNSLNRPIDK